MKKIVTKLSISFFALALLLVVNGCNKYPDGPSISLRSRTARLANTWKIDNYKLNGNDYTSLMSGYSETFTSEGGYSYNSTLSDGTGKWAFQNDDTEVRITGTDNQRSVTLMIQKLENKQLWYYYMDGNDKKELHLVQQ
ncbi:MAG: hypothetical protein HYZ42_09140 [Bacteroidetes bacterium]|nr:hypothetical protein [Bacteroidota bacterium]